MRHFTDSFIADVAANLALTLLFWGGVAALAGWRAVQLRRAASRPPQPEEA